jgi:hypothetical protein
MKKLDEESNNLQGRLVVYEEIKRKYEREKQEKLIIKNDDMASSLYHQRKNSLEIFDKEAKKVFEILIILKNLLLRSRMN